MMLCQVSSCLAEDPAYGTHYIMLKASIEMKGQSCSRVAQRSKALHLSARGVTTDPGSIPGCITMIGSHLGGAQLAQCRPGLPG